MTKNHFYEKKGPFPLAEIVKNIGCSNTLDVKNNIQIYGLESLTNAGNKDITFLKKGICVKINNLGLNPSGFSIIFNRTQAPNFFEKFSWSFLLPFIGLFFCASLHIIIKPANTINKTPGIN